MIYVQGGEALIPSSFLAGISAGSDNGYTMFPLASSLIVNFHGVSLHAIQVLVCRVVQRSLEDVKLRLFFLWGLVNQSSLKVIGFLSSEKPFLDLIIYNRNEPFAFLEGMGL